MKIKHDNIDECEICQKYLSNTLQFLQKVIPINLLSVDSIRFLLMLSLRFSLSGRTLQLTLKLFMKRKRRSQRSASTFIYSVNVDGISLISEIIYGT